MKERIEPQPIETAPSDKKIMVFNELTGWYFSRKIDDEFPYFGWDHIDGEFSGLSDKEALALQVKTHYPYPTHWLPEPDYAKGA